MTNGSTPPGWYADPTGQGDARYWNGVSWTQAVDQGGQRVNIPIDPSIAQQPPVPGTQVQLPAPPPQYVTEPKSSGSSGGVIIGIVIALILIVALIVVAGNNDSTESPTPGTDAPPTEETPAPETEETSG